MGRSANAQTAIDMYENLWRQHRWGKDKAWHGIARMLLSCEIWQNGWYPFHNVVVYKESNAFKVGARGPNVVLRRAEGLTTYLSNELGIARNVLCQTIGTYWRHPTIAGLQPLNLVGHAFRSLTVYILQKYGDPGITYEEEVSPSQEFPGASFTTRSKDAKIDIVARRNNVTVA